MILSEVSLAAPFFTISIFRSDRHIFLTNGDHCVQLSLLIILLMMIALISYFASYLFSSKDRANTDLKIIS